MRDAPRVRTDFPHRVRRVEHEWIPLADGTRLAAKLWLPEDAGPVPAVLCYLPYRKNDGTAVGDHREMAYYAGHGYAGVRVDIRGTGDSDGILLDEYTEQEQLDALETIAWIAAQPWCDGKVGMTGASWGGFNSLQVAARRPPALEAIMPYYFTDDRYADDVHYRGGLVLGMEMVHWATCMLSYNAMPPDPRFVEGWREAWLERLERTPPYVEAWLSHQRRDGYWKHGSVCEDYAAIRCPVFAVGGWTDGYTDPVLRLLEHLDVPRLGLIGPWGHNDPVCAAPGPSIGMLQEAVRWWDHWLKGIDTGIMDEPMLRFWLQEWVEPVASLAYRPGRWAGEEAWPSSRLEPRRLALGPGTLGGARLPPAVLPVRGLQACGLESGAWCADGRSPDLPPDQRAEDGRSLCFDSMPLEEPLEILGFPEATLELESDRPLALVCVRLCDVAAGGASLLVSRGMLNLAHRDGHERPKLLEPGRRYVVRVRLDAIAHRFEAGHHVRLALSPTYWPLAWPSPEPVTLTVHTGGSELALPVRPLRAEDAAIAFAPPEEPPAYPTTQRAHDRGARTVSHDLATGRVELRFDWDQGGLYRLDETGTELQFSSSALYSIVEGDPLSARVECENGALLRRDGWDVANRAAATMTATATHFHVTSTLEAFEHGNRVWVRTWTFAFPRDHV